MRGLLQSPVTVPAAAADRPLQMARRLQWPLVGLDAGRQEEVKRARREHGTAHPLVRTGRDVHHRQASPLRVRRDCGEAGHAWKLSPCACAWPQVPRPLVAVDPGAADLPDRLERDAQVEVRQPRRCRANRWRCPVGQRGRRSPCRPPRRCIRGEPRPPCQTLYRGSRTARCRRQSREQPRLPQGDTRCLRLP